MKIATIQQLLNIPIIESDEPMVVVQEFAPEIICAYNKLDMVPLFGDKFYLRVSVINKLKLAQQKLQVHNLDMNLRIAYGYRHPDIQKKYFDKRKNEVRGKNFGISESDLTLKTHLLTALPDVAGHTTGGAIDLTIQDSNGLLDMGCEIADFSSNLIETFSVGLTGEQQKNRVLLREVLMEQNFAPFDGEWWHFSYGDREWAAYYNNDYAIYDKIDIKKMSVN